MSHWAIAVSNTSDIDDQMFAVQDQLGWDYYVPIEQSGYGFDRVAAVVENGQIVQASFWEPEDQPLISELDESYTILDVHR